MLEKPTSIVLFVLCEGKLGTFYNTYVTFQSLLQASQTIPNTSITYFKMTVSFNRWQSVKLKCRLHMVRYFFNFIFN